MKFFFENVSKTTYLSTASSASQAKYIFPILPFALVAANKLDQTDSKSLIFETKATFKSIKDNNIDC